jgi:tetrahydromethanopterin S-methyltransferase subunit B/cytoskeletal protein CcmA (bactofilin family)
VSLPSRRITLVAVLAFWGLGLLGVVSVFSQTTTGPGAISAATSGPLTHARVGHTATLLPSGQVLIAGGAGAAGVLNNAELFDPVTSSATALTGGLMTGRTEHTATLLPQTETLLIAGGQADPGLLFSTETFDPADQTFRTSSPNVPVLGSGHTATVLLDGRVLITGGQADAFTAQTVVLFTPAGGPEAGTFTVLPHGLATPRWDHTATVLADGRILITGGRNDTGILASAEVFDPATETMTALADAMTTPRAGHTATLLPDGRVLLLGGHTAAGTVASAEVFSPSTNRFSAVTPGLMTPRVNHTATLLPTGTVLIAGGQNSSGILASTELYPSTPADTMAPVVNHVTPPSGATGVDPTAIIGVRFSEPLDVRTLTADSVTLTGDGAGAATISPGEQGLMLFVVPGAPLAAGTTYTLALSSDIEDTAGNALTPFTSQFTTAAAPGTSITITDRGARERGRRSGSRPTVSATVPANAATGVALDAKIAATFSRAMDPATITTATFVVRRGSHPQEDDDDDDDDDDGDESDGGSRRHARAGGRVAGTVSYAGFTATFTPAGPLAPNTAYTATITTGAKDLARNALARKFVWTFTTTTGSTGDTTRPTVSATVPANAATGVATNGKIAVTFSEAMDPSTITTATFTLRQGSTAVAGIVTYAGVTATFTPSSTLAPNATYTATMTTGARDLAGNALAANFVWSFTTGATPDTAAPTVSFTVPANAATGVAISQKIAAAFSEAMDPSTITTATFTLRQGTTAVAGIVTYAGVTATFTPSSTLAPNTTYTAAMTTGARDLAGNALATDFSWTFTTGATPDTTAPTVSFTVPANAATGVAISQKIAATFSEAMDPLTITTVTFTLRQGSTAVAGTVTYAGVTATFNPLNTLAPNTLYTASMTTGARDLAGNALTTDFSWTFTTGATPDTTAPTVSFTVPANGATGVAISQKIAAVFSEAMDPLTITTVTFTLTQGTTPVAGTVTYAGVTATFNPLSTLAPNTTYTALMTTGARDLAGNALISDFVWSFTTGETLDTTAPTVSFTVPANAATGVAINQKVAVTFSEAMDPLTITTVTLTLKQGTTAVAGTVSYAGVTATFNPLSTLAPNTTFTALMTTGARDLAGNALATESAWTFTTGTTLNTTPPDVSDTFPPLTPSPPGVTAAVAPASAEVPTGVPISGSIAVTFTEAMDPLTITTANFFLRQGTTRVPGTVIYAGVTAIFTPASPLAPLTLYTATVTTGARNLLGIPLAADFSWSFITGATPDTTRPIVRATVPANAATAVAINQTITAAFSEALDPLTITTVTVTLRRGSTAVAGTVSYAGVTATFTPASALAPLTTYTATVTTGARDLAGNALATDFSWSFTTGATPDTTRPTVSATVPANGATAVAINQTLNATFSEPMDPLTITTASVRVTGPGGTAVRGTVGYDVTSKIATLTPASNLAPNAVYTATVTTGARDLAGNPLAATVAWSFTTAATPGGQSPLALGAATTFAILAASTVTNAGSTTVNGDIGLSPGISVTGFPPGTVNGTIHVGTPAAVQAQLDLTTAYNDAAGRTVGAILLAGNLGGRTLTPGLYTSTSSLEISSGDLTLDAQGDANAVFIFQIASSLVTTSNRQVILRGGARAANVFWQVGSSATLGTFSVFKGNILALASITVATGAAVEGRLLARTAAVTLDANIIGVAIPADTTAPTVSAIVPGNAATGVAISGNVAAAFSEAMDPSTITPVTFTVQEGTTAVVGAVTYAGVTATFNPVSTLAPNTTYTATVTTGARDLAGNALAADFSWSFTTGATGDTTRPAVSATVPANGATAVAINQTITAAFSEAMDPSTITTVTVTLTRGLTPVAGTVSYAGLTATFTPASALAPLTTYTARVTTGARDLAGNALFTDFSWSFTTGATPDTTPPIVSATVPADDATAVPINQTLNATFSEAMDPLTITTATVRVTGPGGTAVRGTVSYDVRSQIATLNPVSELAPNAVYTATVTTGARDLAGNPLAANVFWSFTTAAAPSGHAPLALGAATTFAILAASTVTNAGSTTVNGDIGLSPGISVTGFPPGTVNGTIHVGTPAAIQAQLDLTTAYNDAAGRTVGAILLAGNLGGRTLTPGLYASTSSLEISSGDLTLDAQGDANAVFIFKMASTLVMTSSRQVVLRGGARAANVFWQVGSSATLGTGAVFKGNILALASITVATGAAVEGRLLARTAAVTLNANIIGVAIPADTAATEP